MGMASSSRNSCDDLCSLFPELALEAARESAAENTYRQLKTGSLLLNPGGPMTLRIRFRFDGRCSVHPRYNPEKDGRPQHKECSGCESLYCIHLYCGIARKKADSGDGITVSHREVGAEPSNSLTAVGESSGSNSEPEDGDTDVSTQCAAPAHKQK
jgi:hypothetical protein